ncbi:hypothetical protein M440DRAFT_261837 [Trichoderma longibrachiatum ATCC 18648]|uniref:Uncharacterized protein n=1 Tax=Trichoderma longibrachiatum ATCC 18648 TaxID=983965 RepID=A0A2T4CA36_TRILO|nr:hypothetical protein M440DRAFT_261837 [Trichoderma longibrachiatum ATCC 18648]
MFIWRGIIDLRRSITYSRCLRSQQHPLTVQGRKRARSKPPISRLPPSRPALSHSLVLSTLGQEKSNRSWIARQLLVPLQRRISRPQHSCTKAFTGRKGGPVSLLLWLISLPPLAPLPLAEPFDRALLHRGAANNGLLLARQAFPPTSGLCREHPCLLASSYGNKRQWSF